MKTRRARGLSSEDRRLWHRVARTTTPLKDREYPTAPDEPVDICETGTGEKGWPQAAGERPAYTATPVARHAEPARPGAIDRTTRSKIAKGRLVLEATVDLHGLTQAEAHSLLLAFLSRAYVAGTRQVLVITGKGTSSGGDGVLRRSVPEWMATPAFRQIVASYSHAARHHGGSGALYVRLRKPRSPA